MTLLDFNTFGIGIIDIVIVISIIIFAIIGWKKGFLVTIVKMASGIFGIVGSILLARPFSTVVDGVVGEEIGTAITTYLTEKMSVIAGEITPTSIRAAVDSAFPTFPEFLREWIAGAISPDLIDNSLASLVNSIQPAIKSIALLVISFIVLFFGSIIIFFLLKILAHLITSLPIIKQIDKVLGVLFGLVKITAILYIVLFLLGLLLTLPGIENLIGEFVSVDMQLGQEQFRLSKWFYDNNILKVILDAFI
jgi:uncharacterized membrane protein required for colicin V production